jgi:hypothetical protein
VLGAKQGKAVSRFAGRKASPFTSGGELAGDRAGGSELPNVLEWIVRLRGKGTAR